jgi:hypothetical protein
MSVRGHHVRGAIGGLVLGLALTIMLTLYGVIRLGEMSGVWITLATLAFGIVWSYVAPSARSKHPAPEPTD